LDKVCKLALSTLLLAISAGAQQVAFVDLTQPPPPTDKGTPKPEKDKDSDRCKNGGVGFADGFTLFDDKEPRQIHLTVVDLNSRNLVAGGQVEATIAMRNAGKKSIRIPWSTDWWTTKAGQDPDNRSWQVAEFRVFLDGSENNKVELLTLSKALYSSDFVSGSTFSLKPGEWITVRINFEVRPAHPAYEQIKKEDDAALRVEWFHTTRSYRVKDCGVTLGHYPYRDAYEQENSGTQVRVAERPPEESNKAEPHQ
jgi:hypothetical protein